MFIKDLINNKSFINNEFYGLLTTCKKIQTNFVTRKFTSQLRVTKTKKAGYAKRHKANIETSSTFCILKHFI